MQGSTRARQLRRNLTDAERRLWYRLRARRFLNQKFRRQVPIGPYVADFACMHARLIVEVDGGQHAERAIEDRVRELFLNEQGFKTLRFWNNEVLGNLDGVLQRLAEELVNVLAKMVNVVDPHPHPSPLPKGEGTERVHRSMLTVPAFLIPFRPLSLRERVRVRVRERKSLYEK